MKPLAIFGALCGAGLGLLAASRPALADDGIPPPPTAMDPSSAINPISIVNGAGIVVGEGTVFKPQVGVETGVVSNVFYENNNPVAAGLLRVLAEVGTGSLPTQRLLARSSANGTGDPEPADTSAPTYSGSGDFQYSANLYASYDQYLSTNDEVNNQGGLAGGLLLRGIVHPMSPLQFSFQEDFERQIRATNFESNDDTNRDVNTLDLRVNYQPTGRSLGGYLYLQNTIDVFEQTTQQFANRLHTLLGLHVNWQWLPLTRVYVDVSGGYYTGIGNSEKNDSLPLTAVAGIQTALTLNTIVNAYAGYTNGFYSAGPSFSSPIGGVFLGYRYSPLGRVTIRYGYEHQDSINANFYRDHVIQGSLEQYFVPFLLYIRPELRLREYDGTIVMGSAGAAVRDDTIVAATVGMRYNFRDWIAATLDYELQLVSTDFRYDAGTGMPIDPSYVRHELLVGVRAAY
ncbi:MAG TPA: hypothetical protein VH165_27970 [Kofleriaceae bacterium]|jgi:hypothetical protein|nr:hypothetical protein [Kofleriaceae bacterium]